MRPLAIAVALTIAAPALGAQVADSLPAGPVLGTPARGGPVVQQHLPPRAPSTDRVLHAAGRGAIVGVLAGAAVGGVAGFVSYDEAAHRGCTMYCISQGGATAIGVLAGGSVGVIAGGLAGLVTGIVRESRADRRVAAIASPTRAGLRVGF